MFTPRRRREALSLASQLNSQILALFAAGEKGAWYDPSDMSTMWQDVAGTIPVNAIGQRVARIDDKSGRGNHATQATTGSQPFLQSASGLRYLDFDGIDDGLASGSIDLTTTDKLTLGMGVQKATDVAAASLIEFSATTATNNGTFGILAPGSAAATNYVFQSKGTTLVSLTATAVAPDTSVLLMTSDIAAPNMTRRINGSSSGSSASTQGTGPLGNFPLYIGRRAGTSIPFTGRVYGVILRAAASSAAQQVSVESWCNLKTGAF